MNSLENCLFRSSAHFKIRGFFVSLVFFVCLFVFLYWLFRATPMAYGGSQPKSWISAVNCRPTPQPQLRQIWASSVTYTTGHGNARSLTHWSRPGIEPTSSWVLVRFFNHWAQWERLVCFFSCFTLLPNVAWILYVFGILIPFLMWFANILPFIRLPFHFVDGFLCCAKAYKFVLMCFNWHQPHPPLSRSMVALKTNSSQSQWKLAGCQLQEGTERGLEFFLSSITRELPLFDLTDDSLEPLL